VSRFAREEPPVVTDLLRLATAGSVDDGKSTLIGRLLNDAKSLMADEVEAAGGDLARLTDGLRAEREQGITIDVAYRHFATPTRRFILADTPGHVQYTRNMVTGASTAELAIVLVDARNGVTDQTRRHAAITALLGVRHVAVAVNKMDLVEYSEERFDAIVRDFCELSAKLDVHDVTYIPISALDGDNVVDLSSNMPWFLGPTLLEHLEAVPVGVGDEGAGAQPARFPVQTVIRPHGSDYRGYAGSVASGVLRVGDEIVVLPRGQRTRIAGIDGPAGDLQEAEAPLSVTIRLEDDVDVSRGDLLAPVASAPVPARELSATLCWLSETPARPGGRYLVKHASRTVRGRLESITHRLDVTTLDHEPAESMELNDIARVELRLAEPLAVDPYRDLRATGAFILLDEATNDTLAAGMAA
jgi:sulfate adenylyltransferase subunit 1